MIRKTKEYGIYGACCICGKRIDSAALEEHQHRAFVQGKIKFEYYCRECHDKQRQL